MKLRNKKTGAIYKIEDIDLGNNADGIWLGLTKYNSLAELNEEWEDYEEPKKNYWYIDGDGETYQMGGIANITKSAMVNIGNYFETKEEAEKAVEKLKAWERLKDAGLKFGRWDGYVNAGDSIESGDHFDCCGFVNAYGQIYNNQDSYEQYRKDLDLLFGGEE